MMTTQERIRAITLRGKRKALPKLTRLQKKMLREIFNATT